ALVVRGPDFAAGGAEVEPHRVVAVAAHRLALDGEPALLGRKAVVLALPRAAAVARAVDRRPSAGGHPGPNLTPVHREDPGRLVAARVRDDREPDVAHVARHGVADAVPALARPVDAIDAAVVLLPEAVGVGGRVRQLVGVLADLRIGVRQVVAAHVL